MMPIEGEKSGLCPPQDASTKEADEDVLMEEEVEWAINNLYGLMLTEKASVESDSDYDESISVDFNDESDVITGSDEEIEIPAIDEWIEDAINGVGTIVDLLIQHEDIIQILEDFLHTLAPGSECTITNRALQHFDKVKNVWGNQHFVGILRTAHQHLPSVGTYRIHSRWRLAEFITPKIKSESSFQDIFEYQDKATMMRNGLSILIGYWSNEDMIDLVLAMGGPSLLTLVKGEDIEEERIENEMCTEYSTPIEVMSFYSPIEELRQDSSIKELADQLLKIPKAVKLVEEFLISVQACVTSGKKPCFDHYMHQVYAAIDFWFNPLIVVELVRALKQSKPLVNVFKKYSKRAQVLRCVEKFTRIQTDPLLGSVFESDDPVWKMRGMLSILFGYCVDRDVCEFYRRIRASGFGLKEDDAVQVVEYVAYGPGDLEGLKNVLAEMYSKDSEEYIDLFDKIRKYPETKIQEKKSKRMEKADMWDGFDLALVIVLLKNGNVMSREVITEFVRGYGGV